MFDVLLYCIIIAFDGVRLPPHCVCEHLCDLSGVMTSAELITNGVWVTPLHQQHVPNGPPDVSHRSFLVFLTNRFLPG